MNTVRYHMTWRDVLTRVAALQPGLPGEDNETVVLRFESMGLNFPPDHPVTLVVSTVRPNAIAGIAALVEWAQRD